MSLAVPYKVFWNVLDLIRLNTTALASEVESLPSPEYLPGLQVALETQQNALGVVVEAEQSGDQSSQLADSIHLRGETPEQIVVGGTTASKRERDILLGHICRCASMTATLGIWEYARP